MAATFRCTLVTPEREVLDEQVTYASIPAWDGQVGVMRQRAPLLVKLGDGALRLDFTAGGSRWLFVGGGFAQVKDDHLTLLTEQAVPADQIVRQEVETALNQAQALPSSTEEQRLHKYRRISRARAMLKLARNHGQAI